MVYNMPIMYTDNQDYVRTGGKHPLTIADNYRGLPLNVILKRIAEGEIPLNSKKPFPIWFKDDPDPWSDGFSEMNRRANELF